MRGIEPVRVEVGTGGNEGVKRGQAAAARRDRGVRRDQEAGGRSDRFPVDLPKYPSTRNRFRKPGRSRCGGYKRVEEDVEEEWNKR